MQPIPAIRNQRSCLSSCNPRNFVTRFASAFMMGGAADGFQRVVSGFTHSGVTYFKTQVISASCALFNRTVESVASCLPQVQSILTDVTTAQNPSSPFDATRAIQRLSCENISRDCLCILQKEIENLPTPSSDEGSYIYINHTVAMLALVIVDLALNKLNMSLGKSVLGGFFAALVLAVNTGVSPYGLGIAYLSSRLLYENLSKCQINRPQNVNLAGVRDPLMNA